MRKLLVILGIPIDDLNMTEAIDRVTSFIQIGRATGKTHQIATVNADFVVKSTTDPELRYLLQDADLATADGMPLVWGARLLGVHLEGRVTGADLVPALAKRAAAEGFSMYLLGAASGVAKVAAQVLREQYPELIICGAVSPPFGPIIDMDPEIIRDIKSSRPDILLVALGNPKQEKWIGMYRPEIQVPVMIGVGGTLDLIAGFTKRAPEWMQRWGLEWVYRLMQEPRRLWRRYVVDMIGFSSFFLRQWWVMRQGRSPVTVLPRTELVIIDNTAVLTVEGRLDISNNAALDRKLQQALAETSEVVVNLAGINFIDSAAIGTLVGATKQARDMGGELLLAQVTSVVQRTFSMLRLDQFFEITDSVDAGIRAIKAQKRVGPNPKAHGDWTVLMMPHRMDAVSAPEILETGTEALQKNTRLVLDFSNTVFLASAGLAVIAKLSRLAGESGGRIRIAGCSSDVRRTIQLVRFDRIVDLFNDISSATV